jgi:ADP-ribose pyrophosphatase YjhB (NUDIX family)
MSNNPLPTVAVVIIENDSVLLVKHGEKAKHPTDSYGLPAGRIEPGEQEVEAAVRELFEESGLAAHPEDLVLLPTIYNRTLQQKSGPVAFTMKTFLCLKYTGTLRATEETAPEWVKITALDQYEIIGNVKDIVNEAVSLLEKQDPRQPQ